jgi:hypothetical protein
MRHLEPELSLMPLNRATAPVCCCRLVPVEVRG